jgi:hypothetical protein
MPPRRSLACENAGLVRGEKRGQFIHYSLVRDNLVDTLNGYVQEVREQRAGGGTLKSMRAGMAFLPTSS